MSIFIYLFISLPSFLPSFSTAAFKQAANCQHHQNSFVEHLVSSTSLREPELFPLPQLLLSLNTLEPGLCFRHLSSPVSPKNLDRTANCLPSDPPISFFFSNLSFPCRETQVHCGHGSKYSREQKTQCLGSGSGVMQHGAVTPWVPAQMPGFQSRFLLTCQRPPPRAILHM